MSTSQENVKELVEENRRLKEENERLMDIMVQMKITLNRLIARYVTETVS